MKSRSSLMILAVGLLVGGALGYAAGRWFGAPVNTGPLAIALPPTGEPAPISRFPVGLPDADPTRVFTGMPRAGAATALTAEGFEAWTDDSVSDQWERFRKPWLGGYHFVNLRFDGDKIAEVGELWNDP